MACQNGKCVINNKKQKNPFIDKNGKLRFRDKRLIKIPIARVTDKGKIEWDITNKK